VRVCVRGVHSDSRTILRKQQNTSTSVDEVDTARHGSADATHGRAAGGWQRLDEVDRRHGGRLNVGRGGIARTGARAAAAVATTAGDDAIAAEGVAGPPAGE
jgi:hypothetical protein